MAANYFMVVISGASRGLGLQIATALGECGASLAIVARRQPELHQAVAILAQKGTDAPSFVCKAVETAGHNPKEHVEDFK